MELTRFLPHDQGLPKTGKGREEAPQFTVPSRGFPTESGSSGTASAVEVSKVLQGPFQKHWERVRKRMVIQEIKDFAMKTKDLGTDKGVEILVQWGEELFDSACRFDIESIKGTLETYPDLVGDVIRMAKRESEALSRQRKHHDA